MVVIDTNVGYNGIVIIKSGGKWGLAGEFKNIS